MADAAEAHQATKAGTPAPLGGGETLGGPGAVTVQMRYIATSSSDPPLARFDILGIDDPIFDPTDHPAQYKNRPSFNGSTPDPATHTGNWAMALEPIPASTDADRKPTGLALLVGCLRVRLFMACKDHLYADVRPDWKDGNEVALYPDHPDDPTTVNDRRLCSNWYGSARILHAAFPTPFTAGDVDAVVLIGPWNNDETPAHTSDEIAPKKSGVCKVWQNGVEIDDAADNRIEVFFDTLHGDQAAPSGKVSTFNFARDYGHLTLKGLGC
jgi:hypothetical protein